MLIFILEKFKIILFDRSNNSGTIDVKMDSSVPEEKLPFKMLGLSFSSRLDWGSYIFFIAETVSKKIGALTLSLKFLSPVFVLYLYQSIIPLYMEYCCHAWSVVLAATWKCCSHVHTILRLFDG